MPVVSQAQTLEQAVEELRQARVQTRAANLGELIITPGNTVQGRHSVGPGWHDAGWGLAGGLGVEDALRLLNLVEFYGFIQRRDAAARKILWEIAERIEKSITITRQWPAKTSKYLEGHKNNPEAKAALEHIDAIVDMDVTALRKTVFALRQQVLADGPPPTGRPLLAERFPEYLRFTHKVRRLSGEAEAMERKYGVHISRNWPGRLEGIQDECMFLADHMALALEVNLSAQSPKPVLEDARVFSDQFWFITMMAKSPCERPSWDTPFTSQLEERFQKRACALVDAFYKLFNKKADDLYSQIEAISPHVR